MSLQLAEQAYISGSAQALSAQAHPDLLQQMSAEALQSVVTSNLQRLGPLSAMTEIRGAADVPMVMLPGQAIPAAYEIDMQFGDTTATLHVGLAREAGNWLVKKFRLDAQLL